MATKAKPKPKPKPSRNGVHPPAPEVLTLAEAAALLRLPEPVVQRMATAGRLPGRAAEGEWRFAREKLLDWLGGDPAPRPLTGAELVEHAQAVKAQFGFAESDEDVEAFLAALSANRQVGD